MSKLDLNNQCVERIIRARVRLLMDHPFFGNLALRLGVIDASKWCNTMAVDGRNMYYNQEFVLKMTQDELMFVVAHEVLHLVYEHLGRTRKDHDKKIANMAMDYVVNSTLVNNKIGTMPKDCLISDKYTEEMSWEEIYEDLMKNAVQVRVTLDEHLDSAGEGASATVTVLGDENGPPVLTEEDIQQIRDEFRAAALSAAQAVGAGKVPLGVRRLMKDLLEPVMDWKALLHQHVVSQIKSDYSFTRPSRRSHHLDVILPGMLPGDEVEVDIVIDASGSMTDQMLRELLSEVKGIMLTFDSFKIRLCSFDTTCYGFTEFTEANIDDIDTYEVKGGGGTDFQCVWDYYKKEDITPKRVVFFTDGYPCGTWGEDPHFCDVLWIVHGSKDITAPFGQTVYYPKAA